MYAALVKDDDTILVYKLLEKDNNHKLSIMEQAKFRNETRPFRKIPQYSDIFDLFIFKNQNAAQGDGQYSMYVVYPNVILLYEGIDRRDAIVTEPRPLSNDLLNYQLTQTPLGTIDCSPQGLIVFDTKSKNQANP